MVTVLIGKFRRRLLDGESIEIRGCADLQDFGSVFRKIYDKGRAKRPE
jgi:hypothetical protein